MQDRTSCNYAELTYSYKVEPNTIVTYKQGHSHEELDELHHRGMGWVYKNPHLDRPPVGHSPLQLSYQLDLPTNPQDFADRLSRQPDFVVNITDMGVDRALIRQGFSYWERALNIQLTEVREKGQIPVFKYTANQTRHSDARYSYMLRPVLGSVENFPAYLYKLILLTHGMGFNNATFAKATEAEKLQAILQIQAHSFGLMSPVKKQNNISAHKLSGSYSVTNTQLETSFTHGKNIFLVPVTPMIADIEAAQLHYGVNTTAGLSNDIYDLFDLMHPKSYNEAAYGNYATIGVFPWDMAGTDTYNASSLCDVNINLRPYTRSELLYAPRDHNLYYMDARLPRLQYMEMPNIQIENVIGGHGQTTITLNTLPNVVDVRKSSVVDIIIDPLNTGHDTVIGFKSGRSQITLERLPFNKWENPEHFRLRYIHANRTFSVAAGEQISSQYQTIIQFDQQNSLTLVDVTPWDFRNRNIVSADNNDLVFCRLFNQNNYVAERWVDNSSTVDVQPNVTVAETITSNQTASNTTTSDIQTPGDLSSILLQEALQSIVIGMGMMFLMLKLAEEFKKKGMSHEQARNYIFIAEAVVMFATGSLFSSGLSVLTNYLCGYYGASDTTAAIASNVVGLGVRALSDFSPEGVAKAATGAVAGYATSRLTLWAYNKYRARDMPIIPLFR